MPVKHALVGKGKGLIEDYVFASSLQMREREGERERVRESEEEDEREREGQRKRDGEKRERDIVSCRLTLQLGISILGGRVLTYADVCTLTHADTQLTSAYVYPEPTNDLSLSLSLYIYIYIFICMNVYCDTSSGKHSKN